MIIHDFNPVLVDLGFLQIRWYSLAYIFGIALGWKYGINIIKKTEKNKYNFEQISKLNFDDDLSFNEFNQLLIEYAKNSPYPNIDQ